MATRTKLGWGAPLAVIALLGCVGPEIRDPSQTETRVIAPQGALGIGAGDRLLANAAEAPSDPEVKRLLDAIREAAQAPFMTGNAVQALIDGPRTLDSIGTAIAQASHHIHLETYIFSDDEVGRMIAAQLKEKRLQGVEIRVLYDAVGSITTPASFFEDMQGQGIEVLAFRPLDPGNTLLFWRMNNRDHRKIIVVDGVVGFTGGINMSAAYSSASASKPGPEAGLDSGWRDTHLRIEGPVVQQLQSLFLSTWIRGGGKVDADSPHYYPRAKAKGVEPVAIVASDGDDPTEAAVYATYLATVRLATKRVWLTQAYLAPNAELRLALLDAVKRGVDVRIVVPGFTDSGLIFHAARSNYDAMLSGGVRLFEQRDALVHAKTAIVDGIVSTIGSANLDMRSFIHNNEANAIVISRDFGQIMERTFEGDLKASREITLEEWRRRGLVMRLKEAGSRLFSYWL